VLEFIRRVSASELRKGGEEGFAKNALGHPPGLEKGLAQLIGRVTSVRAGQWMTSVRILGTGMQFDFEGAVIHRERHDRGRRIFEGVPVDLVR
jgi:hypothetical protein